MTRPMHRCILLLAVLLIVPLAGCDGTDPTEAEPEPRFSITLGAPVGASIKGEASFANGSPFEEQLLRTVPLPAFDLTVTAIQLAGADTDGTVHDVSLVHVADDALTPGTYAVNAFRPACADLSTDCSPDRLFTGSLFTAHYARQTADTLFTYGLDRGTVTVDRVAEDVVRGTFDLSAATETAVARADLMAYIDSLRNPPSRLEPSYFPTPPPSDVRVLPEPLTLTGTFTATPGEVEDWLPRFGWMMGGAPAGPGQP